jgi:hypothetical protein
MTAKQKRSKTMKLKVTPAQDNTIQYFWFGQGSSHDHHDPGIRFRAKMEDIWRKHHTLGKSFIIEFPSLDILKEFAEVATFLEEYGGIVYEDNFDSYHWNDNNARLGEWKAMKNLNRNVHNLLKEQTND